MSLENRNKSQFLGIVVKRAITFRLATDLDRTVKTSALLTACKAPCSVATKCKQYRLVACSPAVAYVPCKRIGLYTIRRSILRCVADSSTLHVLMMIDFFFWFLYTNVGYCGHYSARSVSQQRVSIANEIINIGKRLNCNQPEHYSVHCVFLTFFSPPVFLHPIALKELVSY